MTGANTTTIGTPGTGDKRVMGLAVAPGTRTVWWAQYTPGPAINWARTDGSARGTLDTTGATVNAPLAIAISHRSGRAYWSSFWNIGSASLSGGAGFDIATAMRPGGVAIDDSAGHLYRMEAPSQLVSIKRTDLDGQGVVSVAPSGLPSGGVTALALLFPPVQASAPAITGTATVGSALTCAGATWAADTPE
ncbi:MAG: hypothetical protein FJW92_05825, partial [Actinobacteria bacterium]|nr:hypothetical protein [Actinomycetota bacterium]